MNKLKQDNIEQRYIVLTAEYKAEIDECNELLNSIMTEEETLLRYKKIDYIKIYRQKILNKYIELKKDMQTIKQLNVDKENIELKIIENENELVSKLDKNSCIVKLDNMILKSSINSL
jgi:hypothetical protein